MWVPSDCGVKPSWGGYPAAEHAAMPWCFRAGMRGDVTTNSYGLCCTALVPTTWH